MKIVINRSINFRILFNNVILFNSKINIDVFLELYKPNSHIFFQDIFCNHGTQNQWPNFPFLYKQARQRTLAGIFWHTAFRQTQGIVRKEIGLCTSQTF